MVCFDSSGETNGEEQLKRVSLGKFQVGFFPGTEELLILEDGALDLVKLELLSDSIGLPPLGREQAGALVFQIRCLMKMGVEIQSSVFGLVVHVVQCHAIWLSH